MRLRVKSLSASDFGDCGPAQPSLRRRPEGTHHCLSASKIISFWSPWNAPPEGLEFAGLLSAL